MDLLKLDALSEGGNPRRPIVIASASVIEPMALAGVCPACHGSLELLDHQARVVEGISQRVLSLRCKSCGMKRERYFVLSPRVTN